MTHTLGPWVATAEKGEYRIDGNGSTPIFTIRDGLIPMREDARLIAAAPDLLSAMRKLLLEHDAISMQYDGTIDDRWPNAARIARTAIANATGEAE